MTRYIAPLVISLGILVPSFAMAQSTGNSLLSVYVQVINPQANTFPFNTGRNAADFSVSVSGNNASPATFWGSQTGIQVSLNPGTYAVTVQGNQYGYTPAYSAGCTGTAAAGGTGLCIITMSQNYTGYPNPMPYPYPNTQPALRCEPVSQTAGLRQNVSFTAVNGVGGTYNWRVPGRDYANAGPTLVVSFEQTGSQLVTVTNGSQSATCNINIVQGYTGPLYTAPTQPQPPFYSSYQNPTLTPTYIPRLPNTGVEPITAVQLALALSLLGAAAATTLPYVRKAFAIVTR